MTRRQKMPCPLCGGEEVSYVKRRFNDVQYFDVICGICGFTIRKRQKGVAIASWNMRSRIVRDNGADIELKQMLKLISRLIDKANINDDMKKSELYAPYMIMLKYLWKQIKIARSMHPLYKTNRKKADK